MNTNFEKKAGVALLVFSLLIIFTMILHPVGGSFEYLVKVRDRIVLTHALAILSLPFGLVGFWGLTKRIGTDYFLSVLGFSMVCFALVAVMIAAATNGLVLPLFIERYKDVNAEAIESLKPILRYNLIVNNAFDYIYTGAFSLAILAWSVSIILTRKLVSWIGWLGIFISMFSLIVFIAGLSVSDLGNFRLFAGLVVIWVVIIGAKESGVLDSRRSPVISNI